MVLLVNGIDNCRHLLFGVTAHVVGEMFGHSREARSVVEVVAGIEKLTAGAFADTATFRNFLGIPGKEPVPQLLAVTIEAALVNEDEQIPDR